MGDKRCGRRQWGDTTPRNHESSAEMSPEGQISSNLVNMYDGLYGVIQRVVVLFLVSFFFLFFLFFLANMRRQITRKIPYSTPYTTYNWENPVHMYIHMLGTYCQACLGRYFHVSGKRLRQEQWPPVAIGTLQGLVHTYVRRMLTAQHPGIMLASRNIHQGHAHFAQLCPELS